MFITRIEHNSKEIKPAFGIIGTSEEIMDFARKLQIAVKKKQSKVIVTDEHLGETIVALQYPELKRSKK